MRLGHWNSVNAVDKWLLTAFGCRSPISEGGIHLFRVKDKTSEFLLGFIRRYNERRWSAEPHGFGSPPMASFRLETIALFSLPEQSRGNSRAASRWTDWPSASKSPEKFESIELRASLGRFFRDSLTFRTHMQTERPPFTSLQLGAV